MTATWAMGGVLVVMVALLVASMLRDQWREDREFLSGIEREGDPR